MELDWLGERLTLLPQRAAYWHGRRTLLVADPHFGKAATFRQAGIPIPRGTTTTDLARLDEALDACAAERIVFLGDLLHSRTGRGEQTLAAVAEWRSRHAQLEVVLVRGNHDRSAGDPPGDWGFECVKGPVADGPFVFTHEPTECAAGYALSGHLHPCVRLEDGIGPGMRAACFWFGEKFAVLPSFGSFTGAHRVRPEHGDRVFAVGPDCVVEVKYEMVVRRRARQPR
jgi:DNA ligase-associated metallophosphoesterase